MRIDGFKIEELFAATDWCVKNTFPENYDARCFYVACAVRAILKRNGIKATIVGGDIGAFTLSADGRKSVLQGFGGGVDKTKPSHFWVESNGVILDPCVSYLPKSSRIGAVSMPMIAWSKNNALPKYLQYVEKIRYPEDAEYVYPDDIASRIQDFIECCQKRYSSKEENKKLATWLLSNPNELNIAARSGDRWAKGAILFQSMNSVPTIAN